MSESKATGGTFTLSWGHGISDPIPYDAPSEVITAAGDVAVARGIAILTEHRLHPDEYLDCPICHRPARVEPPEPSRWQRLYDEARDRLRGAWAVLRYGNDDGYY